MKRLIYIITLGFILGIIWGLFIEKVPIFILLILILILFIKKTKINFRNKYLRIINIFIKNNVIIIFLTSAIISNIYLMILNNKYNYVYKNFIDGELIGTIITDKEEKTYKNTYVVKVKNKRFILKVPKKICLEYGDKIKFNAEYQVPDTQRNFKGFNYQEYLKTKKIYGILETDKVEIISKSNLTTIEMITNKIKNRIIENVRNALPTDTSELCLGIIIGYDNDLQEDLQESFSKSSLNHVLAISGMHISYIVLGLKIFNKKIKISKHFGYILITFFLINFIFITDFSSSVIRAGLMEIILLFSIILNRKNDIKTTLSIPLILILIGNPYKIMDTGLILTYLATIGIIVGMRLFNRTKESNKIKGYIKENAKISIFANVLIIPIVIYKFNTISFTFIISNLLVRNINWANCNWRIYFDFIIIYK